MHQFSSVQSLTCVRHFATPRIAARQASLSIINSRSSFKLMSIKLVRSSSHLIFFHPLLLLPPVFPNIRVFFNESVLWCSTFFMVQLSYPCMTTRKTIALTRRIFISNASTFSYAVQLCHSFSSKEQVSFNFMAVVTICSDFGAPKIKSVTVSIVSPSICHEVMGLDAMILVF